MSIRKIFTVARNEINTLFYSPIAWVMLALFTVLTSLDYTNTVESYLRTLKLGGYRVQFVEYLSRSIIYLDKSSLFYQVIDNLYIFLPLLTMGLISRELSSGTIKLLYSSPVRIREIVLGKYVAIVAFVMCMTVISIMLVVALCFSITNPDIPQLIASLTGLFLIMCCYAAVGLFISSLTSYPVVAAIVTCVLLGFLKEAGAYWQDVDVIRNVTYYLNITTKSANFLSGLVNLRDFCYFLILIGTFLALTMIKLKSGTESISRWRLMMRYGSVIAIASLVGYITNRKDVNVYIDTTRAKDFTISKPTQDLLKKLDKHEFQVTLYVNILDEWNSSKALTPGSQNYIERVILEPYYRFKPYMNLDFVYYYYTDPTNYRYKINPGKSLTEIAKTEAKQMKMNFNNILSLEEVSRLVDVTSEEYRSFFHIQYGDEQMIVRIFPDPEFWPSEYEFAAALQRLVITPPSITFLTGDMERDPFSEIPHNYYLTTNAKGNRQSLLNQGFDVDTLSLRNTDVTTDIAALVVADPRTPLGTDRLNKIMRYIDKGGNLLLVTEPDSWQNVEPILEKLGITIKAGIIVQPSEEYSSDIVFPNLTDTTRNLSPFFLQRIRKRKKLIGDTTVTLKMPTVSALDFKPRDGFVVEPLLVTDRKYSWNRIAPITNDLLRSSLRKAPGDEHGDFVTAVRMYRNVNGKEQRIIVASDADYMTTNALTRESKYGYDFQFWCYRYFSYGKYPAMTFRPESIDNDFKITLNGVVIQRILFCWILPSLLAITGMIILIRRKRK